MKHKATRTVVFNAAEYDLDATLASGQAFRWFKQQHSWEGVVGERWVRLTGFPKAIVAETSANAGNWNWLAHYLQIETDIQSVLATFPQDPPMQSAVAACRGLRLLRQDPWECLASFILSSTKQIVQIQQILQKLCERFGRCLVADNGKAAYSFPSPGRLAACTEAELRACKMGFRAPYLRATAMIIARGDLDLNRLRTLSAEEARLQLVRLPGVGRKIADCVLLFAYGFHRAFPIDVWVRRGLKELYFADRRPTATELERFSSTHFGPYSGYAQQYLFHYMRNWSRNGGNEI